MSCPASLSFQDGAPEYLFEPSSLLQWLDTAIPRFGQSDEVTASLFEGEDQSGYLIGVLALSIVVTSILLAWLVLLYVFARRGVGFWSGSVPKARDPPKPSDAVDASLIVNQNSFAHSVSQVTGDQFSLYKQHEARRSRQDFDADDEEAGDVLQLYADNLIEDSIMQDVPNLSTTIDSSIMPPPSHSYYSIDQTMNMPDFSVLPAQFDDDDDDDDDEENSPTPLPPLTPRDNQIYPPSSAVITSDKDLALHSVLEQDSETTDDELFCSTETESSPDASVTDNVFVLDTRAMREDPLAHRNPRNNFLPFALQRKTSISSDTSSASSKHDEYMKYLEEASSSKLMTSPRQDILEDVESSSSQDSDDWLLDEVLGDNTPVASATAPRNVFNTSHDQTSVSMDDGSNSSCDDESVETDPNVSQGQTDDVNLSDLLKSPPLVNNNEPNEPHEDRRMDISFPSVLHENGFLFENENEEIRPQVVQEERSTSTHAATPQKVDVSLSSVLPQSKFESTSVGRKRVLEEYVSKLKEDIKSMSKFLVTDDSTLLPDNGADGIVIRPGEVSTEYEPQPDTGATRDFPATNFQQDHMLDEIAPSTTSTTDDESARSSDQSKDSGSENEDTNRNTVLKSSKGGTKDADFDAYDLAKREEQWLREKRQLSRTHRCFTVMTVTAATLLIVSCLLFILNGVWNLDWQVRTIQSAWSEVELVSLELQGYLTEVQTVQLATHDQIWNVWKILDAHCPLVDEHLCFAGTNRTDTTIELYCDVSETPLENSWTEWLEYSSSPSNLIDTLFDPENWSGVASDAFSLSELSVSKSASQSAYALWIAAAFNTLLAILTIAILAGISLPQAHGLHRVLSSCTFASIFLLTVGLNWLFMVGFLAGTTIAVDSCMAESENGASSVIQSLLGRIDTESSLPEYWNYISDGCPEENFPSFITERVWEWGNSLPAVFQLANDAGSFPAADFEETCGYDLGVVQRALDTLSTQFCMVTESLINVRRELGCDKWYPWYELIVNESMCNQGVTALTWAAVTQFACVFMALILWTCRASFRGGSGAAVEEEI